MRAAREAGLALAAAELALAESCVSDDMVGRRLHAQACGGFEHGEYISVLGPQGQLLTGVLFRAGPGPNLPPLVFALPGHALPHFAGSVENKEVKRKYICRGGRKSKDPSAPKRPISAYSFFVAEQRPVVSANHPEFTFQQAAIAVADLWKALSPDDKAPYQRQAERDRVRYEREKTYYKHMHVTQSHTHTPARPDLQCRP